MPDFFETLKLRRSIRSYTLEAVSPADLQELVEAAVLAPSGMNVQPWAFHIVTSREILDQIDALVLDYLRSPAGEKHVPGDRLKTYIADPGYRVLYNAPALVLITGESGSAGSLIDCQLAMENLFLAAGAKGLGACYMGWLMLVREDPEIRRLLRIPDGRAIMAGAIVGHPAERPEGPPNRRPPQVEWIR